MTDEFIQVRPYRPTDRETCLSLWESLGGWYRTTTSAQRNDLELALRRLDDQLRGGFRFRTPAVREALWVIPVEGPVDGCLYARADDEQPAYVAPMHPMGETVVPNLGALMAAAGSWFSQRQCTEFLVEVPKERPAFRKVVEGSGVILWTRRVFEKAVGVQDSVSLPPGVHPFRPMQLRHVVALHERRYPGGPPPGVPVPFRELKPGNWWAGGSGSLQTRILVHGSARIDGVAGVTLAPGGSVAFVGPFMVDLDAPSSVAADLLAGLSAETIRTGARVMRISVPSSAETEVRAIEAQPFREIAQAELWRLRV
ncbi:MAG TPA: hypothetical protein VJS68_01735 [Thermoplasmata archaeon]|nr:hypothetical protein [Thermoplasmata archaeon]